MSFFPPRHGFYLPTLVPRINRSHRLARKIVFLSVCHEGADIINLADTVRAGSTASTAPGGMFKSTVAGQAATFGKGGSTWTVDTISWAYTPITTSNGVGTGDFTIALLGNPATNASQSQTLFSQRQQAGNSLQVDFQSNQNTSNVQASGWFTVFTHDGGGFTNIGAASLVDGQMHAWIVTRRGSTLTLYKDAVTVATATGTVRDIRGTTVSIGSLAEFTVSETGANCSIPTVAGWNRALSLDEVGQWSVNPGALLFFPDNKVVSILGHLVSTSTVTMRRTLSPVGTRVGSRQRISW